MRFISAPSRKGATLILSAMAAAAITGCTAPPNVAAERELSLAAGLDVPVEFHTVGASTDDDQSSTSEVSLGDAVRLALDVIPS